MACSLLPFLLLVVFFTTACAPRLMAVGDNVYDARFETPVPTGAIQDIAAGDAVPSTAIMADGARLPMLVFEAAAPKAIIIGLHGFNDYSASFATPGPGPWFVDQGITLYAIDQRGFGRAPGVGLWAGDQRMAEDVAAVVKLVRTRHENVPVYLLGESMGGAVAMRAMSLPERPEVDGLILSAPAVWGWRSMNSFYSVVLWAAAHIAPSSHVSGSGLDIMPSDNVDMLRALGRDPLIIKQTRIDAIYGLVNLMDLAASDVARLPVPVLLLYGAKDQIVPAPALAEVYAGMKQGGVAVTLACYPEGYHMLMRDLGREYVWKDILGWISSPERAISSGFTSGVPCEL